MAQRTREIGIRLALGSSRTGVIRLMLRDAIAAASIGIAAGLAVGAGLSRFVSHIAL
ncbi:MAG: FtsX-like permease family protein [Bryobacteraceae bacterium]